MSVAYCKVSITGALSAPGPPVFAIQGGAYQLVDGVFANRVDDMEQQLEDEDYQEKRRHGWRRWRGIAMWGALIAWCCVLMSEKPLCHTVEFSSDKLEQWTVRSHASCTCLSTLLTSLAQQLNFSFSQHQN